MNQSKIITICLHSNIKMYQIIVYDGQKSYSGIINNIYQCLTFKIMNDIFKIVAIPLTEGYSKNLCLIINNNSYCNFFNLDLNFKENSKPSYLYNFTLTDKVYGLPINGNLLFNQ